MSNIIKFPKKPRPKTNDEVFEDYWREEQNYYKKERWMGGVLLAVIILSVSYIAYKLMRMI